MKTNPISVSDLSEKIDQIERQQAELTEALKLLLPMAITIPSTASSSAAALKELTGRLALAETQNARSDTFWLLASAMSLLLSSQAAMQHPSDQEVQDIHRGLRQHKMQ